MTSTPTYLRPNGGKRPEGLARRVVPVAIVVYAAVAALRATSLHHAPTWVAAVVAVVLVILGGKPRPLDDPRDDEPRQLATFALALALAAGIVPNPLPLPSALSSAGAAVGAIAGLRALARASGPKSIVTRRASVPAPLVVLAVAPAALALVRLVARGLGKAAFASDLPSSPFVEGALASVVLAVGAVARARAARLELAVRERTRVAAGLAVTVPLVAVGLAGVTGSSYRAHAEILGAFGALAVAWVSGHGDPVHIARISRRALTLAAYTGPLCLLGALATAWDPHGAPATTFVTAVVVLAASLFVPTLETSFSPASGKLLMALARAHEALLESEASEAIRLALTRVREASGPGGGSPELWMLVPPRVLAIDAAGYPHTRSADVPPSLVDVCGAEPFGILRTECLRALEVRRPDLRGLLAWLSDRSAMAAVLVAAGGAAEGILLVPGANRDEPLALEEALALKKLADSLAAACQGESALFRSLGREKDARETAERAVDVAERVAHLRSLDESRNVAATARLARPAHVGVYSTSIRMVYETLERRVHRGAPVCVVAASGQSVVPYVARAHLGSPRRTRPLVVVDGAASQEHELASWRDPSTSPLGLADGGLLLVVDVAVLPREVQKLLSRALAEKKCPWERPEPLDVALAVTTSRSPEELADEGELEPQLVARLGDAAIEPIRFPRLSERAEDLRALVSDALAREGLRLRGKPLGIDDRAFAVLVEHDFQGEDAELVTLARRLVLGVEGDVVGPNDVRRAMRFAADET
jgi:hypothetical protein